MHFAKYKHFLQVEHHAKERQTGAISIQLEVLVDAHGSQLQMTYQTGCLSADMPQALCC